MKQLSNEYLQKTAGPRKAELRKAGNNRGNDRKSRYFVGGRELDRRSRVHRSRSPDRTKGKDGESTVESTAKRGTSEVSDGRKGRDDRRDRKDSNRERGGRSNRRSRSRSRSRDRNSRRRSYSRDRDGRGRGGDRDRDRRGDRRDDRRDRR